MLVEMNSGDFVYIDYVGRVKDTGEIFDLTNEGVAKKENIFNEKTKYHPVAVIVDGGFVIRGLDDILKEMNVGEKRTVEIEPDKAFGERSGNLVKLVPSSSFREQNIDPIPGEYVTINDLRGRITSTSGGRILVDFNHPLAGKKLEYEIEVVSEIKDVVEKIKSVVHYFAGVENEDVDVKTELDNTEIVVKKSDLNNQVKKLIAETVLKWVEGIKKVKFVDIFEKS